MATWQKRPGRDGYTVRWRELHTVQDDKGDVVREWKWRSRAVPDVETAKALVREIEQTQAKGEHWTPENQHPKPTLEVLFATYLDDRARVLTPRVCEQYAFALDLALRFLGERAGNRPLYPDLLTKQLLGEYHAWLLAGQGRVAPKHRPQAKPSLRPRTPQTARKNVEVLQLAWAWAADDEAFDDVVPRPRTIEMPAGTKDPTIAPTWDEMDACVSAADGWIRKLAVVLRYTGLRVQQAMGLVWDDVDLDRATLRIRGSLGKSKSERMGRLIPVSPHLVAELAGWGVRAGWLIPSGRQEGPREREARGRDMARAWKRGSVRPEVWERQPDHAFRKGITSGLKRLGADTEAVEYLLGHSRPSVRGSYLDPEFLPLREAVGLIPAVSQPVRRMAAAL